MKRIFFLSALKGPVAPMAEVILRRVTAEHEIAGFLRVISQPWHQQPGILRRLTPSKILRRLERDLIYSRWFARRDQRIKQLLAAEVVKPFSWPAISEILSPELNSLQTAERLRALRPDVLIVFGCPLLKPEIFSVPEIATVNLHLGIAPWYRGEHTVFFPLLLEDYDRIGFTLHHIDRGVDTGAVLAQGFPALTPTDDEASIMAKIATMAGDALTEYLRHPEAPGVSQQIFGAKGRVYKGGGRHFWHDLKWSWRRRSGGGRCKALPERRQSYSASPSAATESPAAAATTPVLNPPRAASPGGDLLSFFQRFRWTDAGALQRELVEAHAAHLSARATSNVADEIECAGRLGIALTAADREREAVVILEDALAKARTFGEAAPIAWSLLHLATARQYVGERAVAQAMFGEALEIAQRHALRDIEHYVLHHRGRCYVEQNDLKKARSCFERALEIRLALGEPRADRTREALAALDTR